MASASAQTRRAILRPLLQDQRQQRPQLPPPGPKLAIVTDFDGTLSVKDATGRAVEAARADVERREGVNKAKERDELVEHLIERYKQAEEPILGTDRVPDDLLKGGPQEAARRVDEFEETHYGNLGRAMQGGTRESFAQAGADVPLRKGALRLLASARTSMCDVKVASANPSRTLVEAAIAREADIGALDDLRSDHRFFTEVLSSEPKYEEETGIATAAFRHTVPSGREKVRKAFACTSADSIVYIGDSLADLKPLLESSLPIVVGSRGKLHDALERLGVQAYLAEDLGEVCDELFGFREKSSVSVPVVLSAAGSDSGGGAGIQADIKAITESVGAHAATAITAVTVQDTGGVRGVHPVPVETVGHQLDAVASDMAPDALKTGMVPSGDVAFEIARSFVQNAPARAKLVVDPVLVAASGHTLVDQSELVRIRQALFPLAECITPNLPEAGVLLGEQVEEASERAAQALLDLGPRSALLKGGHSRSADDVTDVLAVDSSASGEEGECQFHPLRYRRVNLTNPHGTGCTLASTLAAHLAWGHDVQGAVKFARRFVQCCLEGTGSKIGNGNAVPLNFSYRHAEWPMRTPKRTEDLRLHVITDENLDAKYNRSLAHSVARSIEGGATMVQIRIKNAPPKQALEMARSAVRAAQATEVPVIVNDNVDLALASGADGVHIGQEDSDAHFVRRLIGPSMILGVTARTESDIARASDAGADYVGSGTVFPSPSKPSRSVIGTARVRHLQESARIPVLPIGGIDSSNVGRLVQESGIRRAAVISGVFDTDDPASAARSLRSIIDGSEQWTN